MDTRETIDAAAKEVIERIPWMKRNWQYIVIAALVLCVLFAGWKWQERAEEAEGLRALVEVGATIEKSEAALRALDARAEEQERKIEAAMAKARELDIVLKAKRAELSRVTAAKVTAIPKDASGVAKALTDAGFPASPVMK